MQHARSARMSADDYLEGELKSDIRHEYVDGEIWPWRGPCRAFIPDMKVRLGA